MRVLHVMNSASGGSAISTLDLVRAMRPEGVTAAAVCHDAGSRADREAVRDAFEGRVAFRKLCWWNQKIRARSWKRPVLAVLQLVETGGGVGSTRSVMRAAEAHGAGLIHTNTILTPEGARAAVRLGLPHLWHVRELTGRGQAFPIAGMRGRVRKLLEGSALVVANSAATAAALRASSGYQRVEVVPNGVDLAPLLAIPAQREEQPLVVAMVGSLASRVKKHALFLRAAAVLSSRVGVEFRVYGSADFEGDAYAAALRRQAEGLGLGGRLRFMGHVEGAAAVMREVDILVHPADQESFGRVLVEAMAAARPVVAPNGGGAAEIVVHGATGFLVPPDRPEALATAIASLLDDAALRLRQGLAGRARAVNRYSLERLVVRMLDCYRLALGTCPGPVSRSPVALA